MQISYIEPIITLELQKLLDVTIPSVVCSFLSPTVSQGISSQVASVTRLLNDLDKGEASGERYRTSEAIQTAKKSEVVAKRVITRTQRGEGISITQVVNSIRMGQSIVSLLKRLRGFEVWESLNGRILTEIREIEAESLAIHGTKAPDNSSAVIRISATATRPTIGIHSMFAPLKDILDQALPSDGGHGRALSLPFNLGRLVIRTQELKTWKNDLSATVSSDGEFKAIVDFALPGNSISHGIDPYFASQALGTGQPHCLLPLLVLPPARGYDIPDKLAFAEDASKASIAIDQSKPAGNSIGPCPASVAGIRDLRGLPTRIVFKSASLSPATLSLLNEGTQGLLSLFTPEIKQVLERVGQGSHLVTILNRELERGINWAAAQALGPQSRCF